jgi:hypothetical protein
MGKGGALIAASSLLKLVAALRLVTSAAVALRTALLLTGVGAVLVGLAFAGKFIYDNWQGITEMFQAFGAAFTAALGPVKPMLDPILSAVSSLWDWFTKLNLELSPEKWKAWGEAAGTAVGEVVRWFAELPARIIAAVGSIDLSSFIKWPSPPEWFTNLMGGNTGPIAKAPNRAEVITGKKEKGGPISRGSTYLVGERGPELITAGRSGHVNKAGSFGSAAGVTVNQTVSFNITGNADRDVIEKIRRVMRDEVRETFRGVFADTGMRMA